MNTSTKKQIISTLVKRFLATLILGIWLTASANAQMLCQAAFTYTVGTGGQVSFTNTSVTTGTNTAYTWWWSGNSGYGTSSQTSPTFTFPYNGTYYVQLNMSDSLANCNSTAADTIVITNAQACQVSFTYTIGTNGQVVFTNTSVGNISYYWGFGDGNSSTQTSPSYTYAYNGTYTVYMWADTTGGYCGGYAQTTIVITNAAPCALSSAYTTTNTGATYIFTDTSTTNPSSTMHEWYVNGTLAGYGNPFTYTFNNNGAYTVCQVTSDSIGIGCADSTCTNITISGMACNDSAYFYLYPDSTFLSTWNAYLYTNNANYPINAVWSWGDGTSSTGLYPSHTYSSAGWYTICVTAYFACGDSSYYCQTDSIYRNSSPMVTINVINSQTGIKNNTNNMTSLKAYPNPFNEDLTVNFTSCENNTLTYAMYDMMGNQIAKENVSVHKGDNEFKINTNAISKGVYFLNIVGNNGKKASTLKVVK